MQVNGAGGLIHENTNTNGVTETTKAAQKTDSSEVTETSEISKTSIQSYSEEELQLLDIDGDGEITSEELNSVIQEHDAEMERVSNEYDEKHKEEAGYAWKNKGAWSDKKSDYMNAKDVLYRDEHPEYDAAKGLLAEAEAGPSEAGPTDEADGEDAVEAEAIQGQGVIINGKALMEITDDDGYIVGYTDEDGNKVDIPVDKNNEAYSMHGENSKADNVPSEHPKPSKIMKSKFKGEGLKRKN